MAAKRKHLYLWKYDRYHQNSNGKRKVFDHGELEESVPIGDFNNDRQSEMIAETGNIGTYIFETTTDRFEIATANSEFLTMTNLI